MKEFGRRNPVSGIDSSGISTSGTVHYNLGPALLYE